MTPGNFTFPAPLRAAISCLPQYPPSLLFSVALNAVLKRRLPPELLLALTGKRLRLRATDTGVTVNLMLTPHGFRAFPAEQSPHLAISASAHDFLLLALRKEDPDTLFFSRRLVMEGDTELGLLIKNTLDSLVLLPSLLS